MSGVKCGDDLEYRPVDDPAHMAAQMHLSTEVQQLLCARGGMKCSNLQGSISAYQSMLQHALPSSVVLKMARQHEAHLLNNKLGVALSLYVASTSIISGLHSQVSADMFHMTFSFHTQNF